MSKPLTGAVLGILIGLATAIFLARQGIWPLDQLTVFFLPGILGLLGVLLLSMGRPSDGVFTLVVSMLILIPMLVWGAFGFGSFDEQGELNGGCLVEAESDVDATTVTDTSRSDPFAVELDGGLSWSASSPSAFQDYDWRIYADLGGIPVTIESGTEANDAGDTENEGDIEDIRAYAEARGINIDLYRGVYKVGGSAAGTCSGFGFVLIEGAGTDAIGLTALIVAIVLLVILLVLTFTGREVVVATTESGDVVAPDQPPQSDPDPLDGGSSDL